jgi:predicted branched-subunit amino acid permease
MLSYKSGGGDILFLLTINIGFAIHITTLLIVIIISIFQKNKRYKQYLVNLLIVLLLFIAFVTFMKNDGFKLIVG